MLNTALRLYRFFFARPIFFKFNQFAFRCSLSGLGVLNYENEAVSGENSFLENFLRGRPSGVIFDVGANIGAYSRKVLETNPQLTVYAFEPHPITFQNLMVNITQSNFRPVNVAVGETPGTLSLYDYEADDGSAHASLYRDVIESIHNSRSIEHKVRVVSLDEFANDENIESIALLKIDTEGNELNVIKGMLGYIKSGKVAAIHFEFNEMNVSSRTYFRDFWNLLPNYDFYRLLPKGMVRIQKYSPLFCEIFAYQNIVALLRRD